MNIFCSLYSLEHHSSEKRLPRQGALLKIEFKDGLIGYADCHPWPELGDKPLVDQIKSLQSQGLTSLTERSLYWARKDAQARHQKKSLCVTLALPKSHYFISDLAVYSLSAIQAISDQGFTHVKIKMGNDLESEIEHLINLFQKSPLKIRLDFNEKITKNQFVKFLKATEILIEKFDFIEDPFPFDAQVWMSIEKTFGVRLAVDRKILAASVFPDAASIFIVKSALHPIEFFEMIPNEKMIVTTYLDHPLGQMNAAYTAAAIDPKSERIHGLLSHHAYLPNLFSQILSNSGPHFNIPQGDGFGFKQQLEQLKWKKI